MNCVKGYREERTACIVNLNKQYKGVQHEWRIMIRIWQNVDGEGES